MHAALFFFFKKKEKNNFFKLVIDVIYYDNVVGQLFVPCFVHSSSFPSVDNDDIALPLSSICS